MTVQSKRIVLIPAYCPDEKLIALVKSLHDMDFTIVVVNDGSKAEQTPVFEAVSGYAEVLTHKKNRGKGAALKTGLEYIKSSFSVPYVVVTADADGQHLPEDILLVCQKACEKTNCLVLGRQIQNTPAAVSQAAQKMDPLRNRTVYPAIQFQPMVQSLSVNTRTIRLLSSCMNTITKAQLFMLLISL